MNKLANPLPNLVQSLQGRDLGHLRIIAELWEVELAAPDTRVGLQRLAPLLLDRAQVAVMVDLLADEARRALSDLVENGGMLPWALFTRRYGSVREMGPGRRDRERPYLHATSPTEALWYRGLIGRAFFDSPAGPEEYAYVPDDLLALLPEPDGLTQTALGRPATPSERAHIFSASDRILDHGTTLLAALRMRLPIEQEVTLPWTFSHNPPTALVLKSLLECAGLLDEGGLPLPEPSRSFLEAPRGEALLRLVRTWLDSTVFNELRLIPGLQCEGDWQNDPLRTRRAVLDFLSTVPGSRPGTEAVFWCLPAFLAAVRQAHPDFQRPAGDYDSWFIRSQASGEFLRGFEHWDDVDGALLRYIITGPLHWLGMVDLAAPTPEAPATAFRWTEWTLSLWQGQAPAGLVDENEKIISVSDARLRVPRLVPRSARYQVARFCQWEGEKEDVYLYRLTPASLERARQAGLRTGHLLTLLRRYGQTVPPALVRALDRWDEHGSEARFERVVILRLGSPELLQALRNSRAARFLGEPLGPTVVVVKPGAWEKVQLALAELGYLAEGDLED